MESTIVYLIILVVSAVGLISIGVVVAYLRLVSKYAKVLEEQTSLKSSLTREKEEILEEAAVQSAKILEEARSKAQEIVRNAEIFGTEEKEKFSKEIEKVTESWALEYRQVLQEAQNQIVTTAQNISKDIRGESLKEIEIFRTALQVELAKSQEKTRIMMENAHNAIEGEVQKYKELRLKQVDETIFELVKEVLKKVLGKEISPEEHEKLVMKFLEEAKRQDVF